MKQHVATIDFGTSKIVTVVGEMNAGAPCDILGYGVVPYDGFMGGRWNNVSALQAAIARSIQDAEKSSARKINEVFVGVPGEFIRVVLNELTTDLRNAKHRITNADVDQLMTSAANVSVSTGGEIIQRSAAWFSVDDLRTMEPAGLRGSRLGALASFIAADTQYMTEVSERLHDLGVHVVDFASASLAEAMMLIPQEEREKTAVLIDVGYLSTELMMVEGDALTYHEVLPLGGGHISAEIAQTLSVTMSMAEQLKRKVMIGPSYVSENLEVADENGAYVSYTREEVMQSVMPCLAELTDMIALVLKDSSAAIPARAQIFLAGGGIAMLRGGKDYLASALGRSVKTPLPRGSKLNSPMYASSVGLLDICCESHGDLEDNRGFAQKLSDLLGLFSKER